MIKFQRFMIKNKSHVISIYLIKKQTINKEIKKDF